ncbi:hypothetical protein ACFQZX_00340 [Mucilaginibacter litoreus]|uniref:Uncharacterized protein n=1 Tax=Mucilaginibacter litoreus TaxID=1048221 RepID=A0ABW3AMG5_9SPHI
MMFREDCENRYVRLKDLLEGIAVQDAPALERMTTAVTAVREELQELRALVSGSGFADAAEEIWFFKTMKPQFYALLIYEVSRYNLEQQQPAATREGCAIIICRSWRRSVVFSGSMLFCMPISARG